VSDTTPEVARRYQDLLLARSPVERLMMSARMFDTARALILASFPSDLSPDERRRRLFSRLYGSDVPRVWVPEKLRSVCR